MLYGLCLAFALAAFLTIRLDLWSLWTDLPLPVLVSGFDKTYVSMPRLLHILSVCYIFAHAPKTSPFAAMSKDNPFVMLGRHSLPVFAVGTVLSLICQVIKHGQPPAFLFDLVMIAVGLGLQFALACYLDWWRDASKVSVKSRDPMAQSAEGSMATPAEPVAPERSPIRPLAANAVPASGRIGERSRRSR